MDADMKTDSPEGKTAERCCRVEIHCAHILWRTDDDKYLTRERGISKATTGGGGFTSSG
jgi:hypothetical protein